jgi:hypothetical protein
VANCWKHRDEWEPGNLNAQTVTDLYAGQPSGAAPMAPGDLLAVVDRVFTQRFSTDAMWRVLTAWGACLYQGAANEIAAAFP